ncbi:protein of unknown function [Clostridium beijerinckii]|nr:protein of unknown function [Clostridium beijerinckii]
MFSNYILSLLKNKCKEYKCKEQLYYGGEYDKLYLVFSNIFWDSSWIIDWKWRDHFQSNN